MNVASFRFHGELNIFLSHQHRNTTIKHPFDWRASVKDMIESLGPPHCEVDLIVVDGRSVDFDYIVQSGVHIDVYDCYGRSERLEIEPRILLRPPFPERPRFVLDAHLGRLSSYLRLMGFDTLYRNDYDDDELAYISHTEGRILLTRDIGLLKRSLVIYGYWVRATESKKRIVEVMRRFNLHPQIIPFRHCLKCNGLVHGVDKSAVVDYLTENTLAYYDEFHQCCDCQQIYWKGSHYERMQQFIDEVLHL